MRKPVLGSIWIETRKCTGADDLFVVRFPNNGYRSFTRREDAQAFAAALLEQAYEREANQC